MAHDPTKVLLGAGKSSAKTVDNHKGVIDAGLLVRLKSDDTLSVAAADGSIMGVSMGRSLSNTARTAICRKGISIPVRLTNSFTPVKGAQVYFSDTTGKVGASGGGFTATNAFYSSGALTGIDEDGNTVADGVAFIDFAGGL